ncbi:MAG: hypothetical protein AAGA85_01775 [Bacteroidota bacterium]
MQRSTKILFFFLGLFVLMSCGGGNKFTKSPVDEIIRDLPTDEVFSLILNDMDVQGNFFETYFHQYRLIRGDGEDIREVTTDWKEVSKEEFQRHVNNMGMEIAARDSTGQLSKTASPPGYNNYVGNPRYGYWNNSGGSSFWAFYGQYAFLSSMFRMGSYPVSRGYYNDWRGNYRGSRPYYGPSSGGTSYYGTNSTYNRSSNPNSSWSRNTSSFKNRVASRTSRSSSSRSSSGSFRSRGGGSGK